jgi:hypothetical protein
MLGEQTFDVKGRKHPLTEPAARLHPTYTGSVLERTRARALPVINRGVDLAPAAQACCGVCRTCATTNVVALAVAAISGAALAVTRFARRRSARVS